MRSKRKRRLANDVKKFQNRTRRFFNKTARQAAALQIMQRYVHADRMGERNNFLSRSKAIFLLSGMRGEKRNRAAADDGVSQTAEYARRTTQSTIILRGLESNDTYAS